MATEHPERTVTYAVASGAHCQASLQGIEVDGYEERQVFALPALRIAVTAHRAESTVCPAWGTASKGTFPDAVTHAVHDGPTVHTWASSFTNNHHIPVERTTEIFADLVQHRLSDATVLKASEHVDTCLAPSTAAGQGMVRDAEILPVDESGLRVEGTLHWLHVASTDTLPPSEVPAKRGHEAMEDAGMLGAFRGTAVHDHWKPSFTSHACQHALCTAHHLRALHCITQQSHQPWANEMAELLLAIKAAMAETPATAVSLGLSELETFAPRDDAVVQAGREANPIAAPAAEGKKRGRPTQPPPRNLAMRLRDFKGQGLAFMYDVRVPCDNNQGARDIRMVQVKQKVSGGFRTLEGAQRFGRICGYLSTARKQAKNVFEAMQDAFEGRPFLPSPETH